MNCQQIDEWLPLYASRDLDERREHLVVAHLQTCASCAKAAAEYRETQDLMHGFGVPAVTDEVYAQIRQQVWRRIEAESNGRSFFALVKEWFQPRLVWAAAAESIQPRGKGTCVSCRLK